MKYLPIISDEPSKMAWISMAIFITGSFCTILGTLGVPNMVTGTICILTSVGMLLYDSNQFKQKNIEDEDEDNEIYAKEEELDDLYNKLKKDDCRQNQRILRELRSFKDMFDIDKESGKFNLFIDDEMTQQVEDLFEKCVEALKNHHQLYKEQKQIKNGSLKDKIKKNRQKQIKEVEKCVNDFGQKIHELHEIVVTEHQLDLTDVRKGLESSLSQARRIKDRLDGLDNNWKEFENV